MGDDKSIGEGGHAGIADALLVYTHVSQLDVAGNYVCDHLHALVVDQVIAEVDPLSR